MSASVAHHCARRPRSGKGKEQLRSCCLAAGACQHTPWEAAGCLLVAAAVLLLVALQVVVLLDKGPAGLVAASLVQTAGESEDLSSTPPIGAAANRAEPLPLITERDLGIGQGKFQDGGGFGHEGDLENKLTRTSDHERLSTRGEGLEAATAGGQQQGLGHEAEDNSGGRGAQSCMEDVGDESGGDALVNEQVQMFGWKERSDLSSNMCGGRRESAIGECEWDGDVLRFPGWAKDGWALVCMLVPEEDLHRLPELGYADEAESAENASVISEGSSERREALQELQPGVNTRPPRVAPIGLDEYRKAALQQQVKNENNLNETEAAPKAASLPQKRVHPDGPRFNYASVTAGAKVVGANKEAKGQGNVLDEDMDKYLRNPCSVEDQWIVIELSQDTRIDTVVISNNEFYSSGPKNVSLFGSQAYPTSDMWTPLGEFTAQNVRTPQSFELSEAAQGVWVRYLLVKLLSHYGSEFYCTLSLVRVHGTDALESFREELVEAMRETGGQDLGGFISEELGKVTADQSADLLAEIASPIEIGDAQKEPKQGGVADAQRRAEVDDLLQTPADLDAAHKREKEGKGNEESQVSSSDPGIEGAKSKTERGPGAGQEGIGVFGRDGKLIGAEKTQESAELSMSGTEVQDASSKPPPLGVLPRLTKEAGQAAGQKDEGSTNKAANKVESKNEILIEDGVNQTVDVASTATVTGSPQTNSGSASLANGLGSRAGPAGANGRNGGDFVLKVLLQKLKGLEMNASLFEGYVSETQQQFTHSLNDLDAEIEALAGKLNGTGELLGRMWARLQAVDEARVHALETRHDLLAAQAAEVALSVAHLRQTTSELMVAVVVLSCLSIGLLVLQCCSCRPRRD